MNQDPVCIYLAGPYTSPDPVANTANAVRCADSLIEIFGAHQLVVFVPHLFMLWHFHKPHDYEYWMSLDFAWLRKCDALFRMAGESTGADREVALALQLGKPVFHSRADLSQWIGQITHERQGICTP